MLQDIHHALRSLAKRPSTAILTVIVFAFAIGANEPIAGSPPPAAQFRSVDDGYFAALGIPVVRGRSFAATETERVVIVDESFAQTYWPNGNALGQRVRDGDDGQDEWSTIIGIVPHVKHESFRADPFENTLYWHVAQRPERAGMFVVRTSLPPDSLTSAARAAMARLDPGLALYDVVRMVVGQGARMIAAGVVLGTACAVALNRVLAARIPKIDAVDPTVLGVAALTLVASAIAASWFPARRAGRVDPMQALRQH